MHVGIVPGLLPDHLLDDVAHSGREDEQRDLMLVELPQEHVAVLPVWVNRERG